LYTESTAQEKVRRTKRAKPRNRKLGNKEGGEGIEAIPTGRAGEKRCAVRRPTTRGEKEAKAAA
jgi:hypothetical protein